LDFTFFEEDYTISSLGHQLPRHAAPHSRRKKKYLNYTAAKALKIHMLVASRKPHCTLVAICTT
jgi:hypothetical protein